MLSSCSAHAANLPLSTLLTLDPTLRQLDIRGDASGLFQAGFLTTSIHHWDSWYTLFPPWIEFGKGDTRKGIMLLGKVALAIGGDNFGRRLVWEEGRVVVSLGYSIVVHWKKLDEEALDKLVRFGFFFAVHPSLILGLN